MHISLPNENNAFSPLVLTITGIVVLVALAAYFVFAMRSGNGQRP